MYWRVEWMKPIDDYILRFLADTEAIQSPVCIAVNIDYDNDYVGKRCRLLVEKGLVETVDASYYRITDRGRAYLDGELTKHELE